MQPPRATACSLETVELLHPKSYCTMQYQTSQCTRKSRTACAPRIKLQRSMMQSRFQVPLNFQSSLNTTKRMSTHYSVPRAHPSHGQRCGFGQRQSCVGHTRPLSQPCTLGWLEDLTTNQHPTSPHHPHRTSKPQSAPLTTVLQIWLLLEKLIAPRGLFCDSSRQTLQRVM